MPYNPASALGQLYAGENVDDAWSELWNELHHQGSVGEAWYAAVPHLVRIQRDRGDLDWNAYALIATIEVERVRHQNPAIPEWLTASYQSAWNELVQVAIRDYSRTSDATVIRVILSVLALHKGLREIGAILSQFDELELREIMDHGSGSDGGI